MGNFGGILFLIYLVISLLLIPSQKDYIEKCSKAGGVALQGVAYSHCIKGEEIEIK